MAKHSTLDNWRRRALQAEDELVGFREMEREYSRLLDRWLDVEGFIREALKACSWNPPRLPPPQPGDPMVYQSSRWGTWHGRSRLGESECMDLARAGRWVADGGPDESW